MTDDLKRIVEEMRAQAMNHRLRADDAGQLARRVTDWADRIEAARLSDEGAEPVAEYRADSPSRPPHVRLLNPAITLPDKTLLYSKRVCEVCGGTGENSVRNVAAGGPRECPACTRPAPPAQEPLVAWLKSIDDDGYRTDNERHAARILLKMLNDSPPPAQEPKGLKPCPHGKNWDESCEGCNRTVMIRYMPPAAAALAELTTEAEKLGMYEGAMCPNCVTPYKCNGPHTPAAAAVCGTCLDTGVIRRQEYSTADVDNKKPQQVVYPCPACNKWDVTPYPNVTRVAPTQPSAAQDERARLYEELLYAVESKHPGETRHQTALRYIRGAENNCSGPHAAAPDPGVK